MTKLHKQLVLGAILLTVSIVLVVAIYANSVSRDYFGVKPEEWGQLGDYVGGILNPLFAVTNIVVFCWLTLTLSALQVKSEEAERREKSIDRTITLHRDYYSSEFYERVRAPAHQVSLKWNLLPEDERAKYRAEVASGWTQADSIEKATKYLNPWESARLENNLEHFWTRLPTVGLTEHQAISIYVRWWGRLWQLYSSNVLDRSLFAALFSDLFSYERDFFRALSDHVERDLAKGKHPPGWIPALRALDALFDQSTR
jgi:hypothetical protein